MATLVNIGDGISAVFTLETLPVILLGLIAGLLVGALPGLTATMAVAVLVPLSFGLKPVPALSMLLAVYVGAISGGAISAILINTPGTPASVATTLDGYPMARQGKAGKALGWAMLGSIVGSVIGILVLILLAPLIAEAALRFSAPEYTAIALLGLTMAVGVAGRDLIKGIVAAVLGLFVGMVGLDPMLGYERFTFRTLDLLGGFPFVPVLIGLFAISEALNQATQTDAPGRSAPVPRDIFPKLHELLAYRWLLIKSGLIGTFIGALPGVGADVASLVSYNEAKRVSKHPERFGRGSEEGVIASETANNAVVGGALIPLLTLAIPGDAVTAVLLGALMMHGLRAGPLLFQQNPDEVIAMYVALIVAVIFLRIVGVAMIRVFARVVNIKQGYLIPGILLLCFVGSYAVANNVFDMTVAVAFGVIGFLMQRFGYPVAPMVLALILGPLAEEKLRQALVMSQGSWLIFIERPIAVVLLILAGLSLVFAIRQQRRLAAMQEQLAAELEAEPERR
jgi:putative tricarboxylic transport membrane protein